MNVSLIGMSGAGKSYIGRMVADALDLLFVDIDQALEADFGKELPAIIADIGDEGFIAAEAAATIAQTTDRDGLLISTGGSVVYSDAAMEHLRATSTVVYLSVPKETLVQRVKEDAEREERIVRRTDKTIQQLIDERAPLYARFAHVTVEIEGLEADQLVRAIIDAVSD
jgi:shikimate kinase